MTVVVGDSRTWVTSWAPGGMERYLMLDIVYFVATVGFMGLSWAFVGLCELVRRERAEARSA